MKLDQLGGLTMLLSQGLFSYDRLHKHPLVGSVQKIDSLDLTQLQESSWTVCLTAIRGLLFPDAFLTSQPGSLSCDFMLVSHSIVTWSDPFQIRWVANQAIICVTSVQSRRSVLRHWGKLWENSLQTTSSYALKIIFLKWSEIWPFLNDPCWFASCHSCFWCNICYCFFLVPFGCKQRFHHNRVRVVGAGDIIVGGIFSFVQFAA